MHYAQHVRLPSFLNKLQIHRLLLQIKYLYIRYNILETPWTKQGILFQFAKCLVLIAIFFYKFTLVYKIHFTTIFYTGQRKIGVKSMTGGIFVNKMIRW